MASFERVSFFADLSPAIIEACGRRRLREASWRRRARLDFADASTHLSFTARGKARAPIRPHREKR